MTVDQAPAHRSIDQLNAALDDVRRAPRDEGRLHLIVRRPAVGARDVLDEGVLEPAHGLVGDTWRSRAGSQSDDRLPDPGTQVTLMSTRAIAAITPDETRWPLAGDQLFVDLDLADGHLPPGSRLIVGDAILEVAAQPHTGCGKFVERFGVDAMKWVNSAEGRALHLRGIYARVVQAGRVRVGDTISVRR